MMLNTVLLCLIFLPMVLAGVLAILPIQKERPVSLLIISFNVLNGFLTLSLAYIFISGNFIPQEVDFGTIFSVHNYSLKLQLLMDHYSVSFQVLIGFLAGLVFMFSRRYMHREPGYRRFFSTLLAFLSGISLVALADTIDLLFAGWEIVGVSSFLLIGFYQNRRMAGRNALRAFTIYRMCDVGLFLGAWLFHELGSEFTFLDFSQKAIDPELMISHSLMFTAVGFLTLFAAMGKSAQYPFTFWVPRAMEGPTPSSAIFYGALSIHAGVYLLIRLYPIWHAIDSVNIAVGCVGLVTTITSALSSKTQSNIKGQIGYASVAQVGIMFIELSLGFRDLATIHLIGNAILRCYQLLASPSVLVIFLKLQSEGAPLSKGMTGFVYKILTEKMRRRLFAFSFNEAYSEAIMQGVWNFIKRVSRFINRSFNLQISVLLLTTLTIVSTVGKNYLGDNVDFVAAMVLGSGAIHLALIAIGEKTSAVKTLNNASLSAFMTGVSTAYLNSAHFEFTAIFFAGIAGGYAMARYALWRIPQEFRTLEYAGNGDRYPGLTLLLLAGILWLAGFTLSPTFIGEDLLLHFGAENFVLETFIIAGAFILNGITLMRMYVKLTFARF